MGHANIKTVAGRSHLAARREPYWERVGQGCYLGYRLMTPGRPGNWVARYIDATSGKKPTKSFGDLSEHPDAKRFDLAKEKASEWFAHLGRGGSAKTYTLKDALDAYVEHLRNERGDAPANDAQTKIKQLVAPYKRMMACELDKLVPGHLHSWRTDLLKSGKAKSTINRNMVALRAALNLAHRTGWVTSDHAWRQALAPIGKADERRDIYLNRMERDKLLRHCSAELAAFVKALCLIPLRPGAAAALRVGDLDVQRMTLKVVVDKAGAGRTIGLPKPTVDFLEAHAANKQPNELVFTCRGKPWNKDRWKLPFKAAVLAAEVREDAVIYSLRHSTITDLILNGVDPLTVARIAGTSVQQIQKHYGHLVEEKARAGLTALVV